jgi:hypothetical protein
MQCVITLPKGERLMQHIWLVSLFAAGSNIYRTNMANIVNNNNNNDDENFEFLKQQKVMKELFNTIKLRQMRYFGYEKKPKEQNKNHLRGKNTRQ